MSIGTIGLHHVTAMSVDPVETLRFYRNVLKLRLVKWTVNFDQPDIHHFYFGDEDGQPGTLVTLFPFPDAGRGHVGSGGIEAISLAIPEAMLERWILHLVEMGIDSDGPRLRFDRPVLQIVDPWGLRIELVALPKAQPALAGVTLAIADIGPSEALLVELMGYRRIGTEAGVVRLEPDAALQPQWIDLRPVLSQRPQEMGAGIVHHVAFRVADRAHLARMRQALLARGLEPTDILDRRYFESVYVREPGGILFEFATDPPGFAIDEPRTQLGAALQLPPALEPQRAMIERRLAPITPAG
jgi:glyoxalase family protein